MASSLRSTISRTLKAPNTRAFITPPRPFTAPSSSILFKKQNVLRPTPAQLQLRWLSDATRTAIDKAVASAPVVLFMKGTPELPQCGFSRASIQVLGLQGVDPNKFTAFNVLEDEELRQGIKEYSNWPTIPQLYINKEFVGGCDILLSMHSSGELAELLEKSEVLAPADADTESTGKTASHRKNEV